MSEEAKKKKQEYNRRYREKNKQKVEQVVEVPVKGEAITEETKGELSLDNINKIIDNMIESKMKRNAPEPIEIPEPEEEDEDASLEDLNNYINERIRQGIEEQSKKKVFTIPKTETPQEPSFMREVLKMTAISVIPSLATKLLMTQLPKFPLPATSNQHKNGSESVFTSSLSYGI